MWVILGMSGWMWLCDVWVKIPCSSERVTSPENEQNRLLGMDTRAFGNLGVDLF